MSIETTGENSGPKLSVGSAEETEAERCDQHRAWFPKTGTITRAYRLTRLCVLCGKRRRLFIEQEKVEVCYLDFEAAGFNLDKALNG